LARPFFDPVSLVFAASCYRRWGPQSPPPFLSYVGVSSRSFLIRDMPAFRPVTALPHHSCVIALDPLFPFPRSRHQCIFSELSPFNKIDSFSPLCLCPLRLANFCPAFPTLFCYFNVNFRLTTFSFQVSCSLTAPPPNQLSLLRLRGPFTSPPKV